MSVCALLFFQSSFCQARLPRLVRDSMILQRDTKVKIWGWASPKEKIKVYDFVKERLASTLEDEMYLISKMATINCILKENFSYYSWIGFYLVHNGELLVGPYQGTFGCVHIPFGKGVCGTAAKTGKTQVVPDVRKFPGHIACDWRSQSEIVVPVFDKGKKMIAVFDVDSTEKDSFDDIDKKYLEEKKKKKK